MDQWENAGAFLFRFLPETSIRDYLVGERPMLTITKEGGKWWLKDGREQGSSDYQTEDKAKAAGDAIIKAAEEDHDRKILAEAGLDVGEWEVLTNDGLEIFHPQANLLFVLNSNSEFKNPIWDIYHRDDQIASDRPTIELANIIAIT